MHVAELREPAELEHVRQVWHDLACNCGHDTPYVLPEFLLPWMRRLENRYRYRFLLVWQGAQLVGLAPVVERNITRLGIPLLRLRGFPEAAPNPPCDVLVREGSEGVAEAMFDHWQRQQDWDVIELPTVPVESNSVRHLIELARGAGWHAESRPAVETYAVPVCGSWEEFHASRSKKTRQNLRRGLRYFEGIGTTRFATYPGDLPLGEACRQVAHVVARSWKEHEEGPSGWNAFLRDIITEFDSTGLLRLHFLLVNGDAVAYLLDVPFRDAWYAIHNAYDLRFPSGNAGQLVLAHALEDAHRRGVLRYDFTGDKDYLRRWTKTTRRFQNVRIHRAEAITRLKLRAYDWIHGRRTRAILSQTELDKAAKKDAERDPDHADQ